MLITVQSSTTSGILRRRSIMHRERRQGIPLGHGRTHHVQPQLPLLREGSEVGCWRVEQPPEKLHGTPCLPFRTLCIVGSVNACSGWNRMEFGLKSEKSKSFLRQRPKYVPPTQFAQHFCFVSRKETVSGRYLLFSMPCSDFLTEISGPNVQLSFYWRSK